MDVSIAAGVLRFRLSWYLGNSEPSTQHLAEFGAEPRFARLHAGAGTPLNLSARHGFSAGSRCGRLDARVLHSPKNSHTTGAVP